MKKNKIKNILSIAISICVASISPMYSLAAVNVNTDIENYGSITLGDIQQQLIKYLEVSHPELKLGTDTFYEFAMNQLLYDSDSELSKEENYSLVHAYLAEYVNEYGDYTICKDLLYEDLESNIAIINEISDDAACVEYNEDLQAIEFSLNDEFLNQTITDLIEKNESNESDIMPASSEDGGSGSAYSYSGSLAATYARKYALSYNSAYPSYSSDCTNFVSQCIKSGGLITKGSSSTAGIDEDTTKWYCKKISSGNYAVTTSWMRVKDFKTHMASRTVQSLKTYTSHSTLYNKARVGDVVQLVNVTTGTPYHTIIVSKRDTSAGKLYYCAHTNDRKDTAMTNISASSNKFIWFDFTP